MCYFRLQGCGKEGDGQIERGWTEKIPGEKQAQVEVGGPHPFGRKDFPALVHYFSRDGRESR